MIRSDPLKVCALISAVLVCVSEGFRVYGYPEVSWWLFWVALALAGSAGLAMKYRRR